MREREHVLNLLSIHRAVPFSYDHNVKEFSFGQQKVLITDIPTYGSPHQEGDELTSEQIEISGMSSAFLHGFRNPIQTTFGKTFIQESWSTGLEGEVNEIMADVMVELTDGYSQRDKKQLLKGGSFDTLAHTDEGSVRLRTVGQCACIGLDFTVNDWHSAGFAEYTSHNVDRPAQRASLLAGLGHIAKVAEGYRASFQVL